MVDKKLTIYVSSPDSYSDVFKLFLECYKKNWSNSSYELVLSTNQNKYEGIRVINNCSKDDGWVDRTLVALNSISTEYILLMCDDLFVLNKPDETIINNIVAFMDDNSIDFCSFDSSIRGKKINKYVKKVKKKTPYALNLQIGIYRKEYLLSALGDGSLNAWEIEKQWIKSTLNQKNDYFDNVISINNKVINYVHGIVKGKWLPTSYKKLEKNLGHVISTDRKVLSKRQELFLKFKYFGGKLFSPKKRYIIKKVLSKFGFKFITEN